jgi:hypothetical protein
VTFRAQSLGGFGWGSSLLLGGQLLVAPPVQDLHQYVCLRMWINVLVDSQLHESDSGINIEHTRSTIIMKSASLVNFAEVPSWTPSRPGWKKVGGASVPGVSSLVLSAFLPGSGLFGVPLAFKGVPAGALGLEAIWALFVVLMIVGLFCVEEKMFWNILPWVNIKAVVGVPEGFA